MKRRYILLIIVGLLVILKSHPANAQLNVTDGVSLSITPLQLVQQVLVGGGVTVSNAKFNGSSGVISSNAIGTFNAVGPAQTQLGFQGGILITSGQASIAVGPNMSPSEGTSAYTGSDVDLQALIPGYDIYDATILEFDFVPISDTIMFRYIFGSEEFPEYCYSSFNDVFGFFVSGPGISGPYSNNAVNIALMPNGVDFVTIDNLCGSAYIVDNSGGMYIQYDQFSVILTAWCIVQACEQYHLKIAIGDAGDDAYDSGVFLEANSLVANGLSYNTSFTSNIDTLALEGCNNAIVSFQTTSPATDTMIIHYNVIGTATEGVDYPYVPDSLILYPGQDSVGFLIIPYPDGITEPEETVFITYLNSVCGSYDTIKIYIKDYSSTVYTLTDDVVHCDGSPVDLNISANGGYSIKYLWSTGDTVSDITVSPATPTTYFVTIYDDCGINYDSVRVAISNLSSQLTDIDSISCYGYDDGAATVTPANGIQPYSYNWSNGETIATPAFSAGNYSVTVTDGVGCTSTNSVSFVNPPQLQVQLTTINEKCEMSCDGEIICAVTGNPNPPYAYEWSTDPVQTNANADGLCDGDYTLTVTYSAKNCTITATSTVYTDTYIDAEFVADPTNGYIPITVDFTYTGYGADYYEWHFGDGDTSGYQDPSHTYTTMGDFVVLLIINSGPPNYCIDTFRSVINAVSPSFIEPYNVFTPNGDFINDEFAVKTSGLKSFKIIIFNRWGKKVHETEVADGFSDNITDTNVWDGRNMNGGDMCSEGTYFYIIEAVGYDSQTYSLTGSITLLR